MSLAGFALPLQTPRGRHHRRRVLRRTAAAESGQPPDDDANKPGRFSSAEDRRHLKASWDKILRWARVTTQCVRDRLRALSTSVWLTPTV